MGAPRAIALCQCFNGALEYQAVHWAEAETSLREAIALFHQIGAADGEAISYQRLGLLQTAQGRLDEALSTLEDGVVTAQQGKLRAHIQGRLYATIARNRLLAGDLHTADHALSLAEALTANHSHCALCEALLLPVAVSVRIAQDNLTAAEKYCTRLVDAAARYGSYTWVALSAQAQGELAAARGDQSGAVAYYTDAWSKFHEAKNDYAANQCAEALNRLSVVT